MSELSKVDSGTPEFDALVLMRYRDFPRVERELKEAKELLTRAADALDRTETRVWKSQWVENLIAELRKAAK